MTTGIHPTAVVHPDAALGAAVTIGPFAVVGPDVEIGEATVIGPHAVIERHTRVGRDCYVGAGAILGSPAQDLKYDGGPTRVEIGDGTRIREYATINRASTAGGVTRVGERCFLMTYVHVAHDCDVGDEVVIANAVQLAGHVRIGARAQIGGSSAIHQFTSVGTYAFVGGGSRVTQDVPPYARAAGNPLKLYGINGVGLSRAGLEPPVRHALKRAYRLLFNSRLLQAEAIDAVRRECGEIAEVAHLLAFVAASERGVPSGASV